MLNDSTVCEPCPKLCDVCNTDKQCTLCRTDIANIAVTADGSCQCNDTDLVFSEPLQSCIQILKVVSVNQTIINEQSLQVTLYFNYDLN